METIYFRFRWVDATGEEEGLYATDGTFDGETLVLGDISLPATALLSVDNRGRFVLLTTVDALGETRTLRISLSTGDADELKTALGRARAGIWSRAHREALQQQGRDGEYREVSCPHCQSAIDLTGMPRSPQVYCAFCHRIGTVDAPQGTTSAEGQYRLCDVCGMYSKPRRFTIFYFYFLFIAWGVYHGRTWRCPACMRGEAWKMLLLNLLFVVGVPVALVQLFRSYGGTDIGSLYQGIHAANLKARKGNLAGAIEGYRKILMAHPAAAGIKYNIGMAALAQNDPEAAAGMLEQALRDCSNYQPAAGALSRCYKQAGEEEKLRELHRQWDVEES